MTRILERSRFLSLRVDGAVNGSELSGTRAMFLVSWSKENGLNAVRGSLHSGTYSRYIKVHKDVTTFVPPDIRIPSGRLNDLLTTPHHLFRQSLLTLINRVHVCRLLLYFPGFTSTLGIPPVASTGKRGYATHAAPIPLTIEMASLEMYGCTKLPVVAL